MIKTKNFFICFLLLALMIFSSCKKEETPANNSTDSKTASPVSTHEYTTGTKTVALIPFHELDCDNIDQQLASEIKTAYYDFICENNYTNKPEISDLYISRYAGKIGDCHIVMLAEKGLQYPQMIRVVEVAEYYLKFPTSQLVYAYHEGYFYTVKEAYENNLLSRDDVYHIGIEFCIEIPSNAYGYSGADVETVTLIPVH